MLPALLRSPPIGLQAIIAAAALMSLAAYGINIQPLLAFGSISTLAVGLATQSTATNLVSALTLVRCGGCGVGGAV